MTKKKQQTITEIEESIYGKDGLYDRTIKKMSEMEMTEIMKLTGKKRQYIDLFKRQFKNPESFDYRPKLDTIKEIAESLGVE